MKTYKQYVGYIKDKENKALQKEKDEYHKDHEHKEWNVKKQTMSDCGCFYIGAFHQQRSEQSLLTEILLLGMQDFLNDFKALQK